MAWRNRRRVELHVITATRYIQRWTQADFDSATHSTVMPGDKPNSKLGSWRRTFAVLEFKVTNEYPSEIAVGRFVLDGWMFDDRYHPDMYAPKRDYRVFDLYTHDPVNLSEYKRLSSRGAYALRVEVYEDTDGPWHTSSKSRYWLDPSNSCMIEYRSDAGACRRRIRFPHTGMHESDDLNFVYRWSDLLPEPAYSRRSYVSPQGTIVKWYDRPAFALQARWWVGRKLNWLLYGKTYHTKGDETRPKRWYAKLRRAIGGLRQRGQRNQSG